MSIQSTVTLNSVVYNPSGARNGLVYWYDRSGGVANSFSPLTQGFTANQGAAKRTKISFRVVVPSVAATDTTCSCSGSILATNAFTIVYEVDPSATAAQRTDLRKRAMDLAASALVTSAVDNLDPAFA